MVTAAQRRMARTAASHERRVQKTYGLKPGEYQAMLEAQGGRCAICGNKPVTIRLAVDHDHQTGRVRGLLCKRCNRALGIVEGDNEKMERLVSYIRLIQRGRTRCNPLTGYHSMPHRGCRMR